MFVLLCINIRGGSTQFTKETEYSSRGQQGLLKILAHTPIDLIFASAVQKLFLFCQSSHICIVASSRENMSSGFM